MKIKNILSGLFVGAFALTQVGLFAVNASSDTPLTAPLTSTVSPLPSAQPSASPSATPVPANKFSNLSAEMPYQGQAVFRFNYSGLATNYFYINASTTSNMSWDIYWNFANGARSPITLNNPTKWGKYSCGTVLYWQVVSITGDKSPIQRSVVSCATSFSNLSSYTPGSGPAVFNFTYSGTSSRYYINASTTSNMSWDIYWNFANGTQSPVTLNNPSTKWAKYACGKTIYWQVVTQENVKSPIQSFTVDCNNTGIGTSAPLFR